MKTKTRDAKRVKIQILTPLFMFTLFLFVSPSTLYSASENLCPYFPGAVSSIHDPIKLGENTKISGTTDHTLIAKKIDDDKGVECDNARCRPSGTLADSLPVSLDLGNGRDGDLDVKDGHTYTINSNKNYSNINLRDNSILNIKGDVTIRVQSHFSPNSKNVTINIDGNVKIYADRFEGNKDLHIKISSTGSVKFFVTDFTSNEYSNASDFDRADQFIIMATDTIDLNKYQQFKGLFFSKKDAKINEDVNIIGAITAAHIDININVHIGYAKDAVDRLCGGGVSSQTGLFDAWDTFRDDNTTPPTDRNISAKIVNQPFHLSLASLNKTNNAYETKMEAGNDINVTIYRNDGSLTPISNTITFDANTTSHVASSDSFNIAQAYKNAVVGFKLCATYENNTYYLYSNSSCSASSTLYDCNATTNGTPTWHICYSSDDFAIRPYSFKVFGQNQYKRAGEDFNITIKAVDEANASKNTSGKNDSVVHGTPGYNAGLGDLKVSSQFYTPTAQETTQMQNDSGESNVSGCPHAGTFTIDNPSSTFSNGEINTNLKFSETGILNLNVSEINGSEWAKVDAKDTNWSTRQIKPSTISLDESDINKTILQLFVPYSFNTTATYGTTNNKNWVYMNTMDTQTAAHEMSAYLDYNITAYNKSGAITQNYTKTCFPDTDEVHAPRVNGLKLNTTFDLFLNADINMTDINGTAITNSALFRFYTEDNNSHAVWTLTPSQSFLENNNSIKEWISPLQFENGVGKAKVHFNVDRNISTAKNPINIEVIDVNTSTSWMANPGSPKDFNGTILDQNKTFYYGRVHAPDYRFEGNNSIVTGTATIYYEVYSDQNKSTRNSFDINGSESVDSINWYVNNLHTNNVNNDGDVKVFKSAGKVKFRGINYTTATNQSVSGLILNGNENIALRIDTAPYKDKIDMNASSWLVYNPANASATTTDFLVEFYKKGSWAGQGNLGKTVDLNVSTLQNKRLDW